MPAQPMFSIAEEQPQTSPTVVRAGQTVKMYVLYSRFVTPGPLELYLN